MNVTRWPVPNAAYHADRTHVSASALKVFARNPAEYFRVYVAGTQRPAPPTEPMILGSAVHHLVLEADSPFEDEFAIAPDLSDCRTADGKPAKNPASTTEGKRRMDEFESTLCGRMPIARADYDRARAISRAIRMSAPYERLWINCPPDEAEVAYRWEDDDYGLRWKCKPDAVGSLDGRTFRLDLKVLAGKNAEHPAETYMRNGYALQTALYDEGLRGYFGGTIDHYMVVAVSEPPHDVTVFRIAPEWVELGRRELVKLRANLAASMARHKAGDGFIEAENRIIDLPIPAWALARLG